MFQNLDAYKLKWIAIIGMVLSHAVYAWHETLPLWLMIPMMASGGLTYPIMSYFVVEGYRHTSNVKKYLLRLFIFGVIAIPFYPLVFRTFLQLNIMFSIMLSIIMFMIYDKINKKFLFWLFVFPLILIASLFVDWWVFGIIMMIMSYTIKNESVRRIAPPIVSGALFTIFIVFGIMQLTALQATPGAELQAQAFADHWGSMDILTSNAFILLGSVSAAILLKNYNGERGKRAKWLFYIAYPLHFIVLGGVALALGFVGFPWF